MCLVYLKDLKTQRQVENPDFNSASFQETMGKYYRMLAIILIKHLV